MSSCEKIQDDNTDNVEETVMSEDTVNDVEGEHDKTSECEEDSCEEDSFEEESAVSSGEEVVFEK